MAKKLVKLILIFGPVQGSIKIIKKYANPGQTIDESLMSLLCLPRLEYVNEPEEPKFQTFLVTREDGQILYGSGLIVYRKNKDLKGSFPETGRYAKYCYAIITECPFIHATKTLLQLIWKEKCDDVLIKSIMNIPLPARRKCLRIVSSKMLNDIYLYRGDLPLLDYPLRELFNFLQVDDFLLAYACILMEFKTLIISQDNYKLMMVGETLTSLLLPLKWSNVYVPILPPVYGATYLDAPTSYIMGINTQVTELPENLNHVQCRIYCDESRVVCDVDSLALPLFLNDIKKDIMRIMTEFQELQQTTTKSFNYLDDLKFNRAIRVLFIRTIKENILANYERYIVDVPESSSKIRQFDEVPYLSDQPEFMRSFLSKFLDTQLFASFIDENARRLQQSWLSIFDMDPDELADYFSDQKLENAFQTAHRIQLKDLASTKTSPQFQNNLESPINQQQQHQQQQLDQQSNNIPTKQMVSTGPVDLINEIRDLTKQILIGKMNDPVRELLSSSKVGLSSRSNTLICSLCDLIERVWAHGAFTAHQSSCPLWNHLVSFTKLEYYNTFNLNWFKLNKHEKISPLARDLINDLKTIHTLKDVKTDVGKARAFIRLSLEQKKLSKHLKTLIGDQTLLNSLYKPYAFLRCEEEREQFLMYLLTLNAVDLPCFTTTFVSVIATRQMNSNKPSA